MSLRTQRIDINPLRDFRYVANATRYTALDMFASQTRDLYHIETVRKGGYIEFAARQIYRAEPGEAYRQIAFVHTNAVLVKKRGRRIVKILCPLPVCIIKFQKLSFRVHPLFAHTSFCFF